MGAARRRQPQPGPPRRTPRGLSYLVVPQEEGQQHEHPPVMDDPPDIDVAL